MKLPLSKGDTIIRTILLEHWQHVVTGIHFIPVGDSAYSYRIETQQHNTYYLKIIALDTVNGRDIATRMKNFSLPLQRLIAECSLVRIAAPLPQPTIQGMLYVEHESFLFALYSFIPGETFAHAYPMQSALVEQIGQALATLHSVRIPSFLEQHSPEDGLTKSFDSNLLADVASLESISIYDASYLQQLREVVWPRREQIQAFLARSQEYATKAQQITVPLVVCHGDAWGGNIIPNATGGLTFLDWEASLIAPAERDVFIYMGYVGLDFVAFRRGYQTMHKKPVDWHVDLLAYYAYRLQMRNLAQWLHNLLHESYNEAQHANDVTMIEHHCLDRLNSVETAVAKLRSTSVM